MSQKAYSDLKSAWYIEDIEKMRRDEQIVPKQIHFIISDLCNQDCSFCAYRSSKGFTIEQFGEDTGRGFTMNPNRKIPGAKAMEILFDAAELGVRGIQFTGGGEPTVHPDHLEIFRFAQDRGLKTALVTNGAILRDGWQETYRKMSWIRVSVDAGRAETYASVRRVNPKVFFKVLGNIKRIADVIHEECLLGAGYVVTRENHKEILEGISLLKETGAAYVRLAALFSTDGPEYYDGIYDEIRETIEVAREEYEDETFKIVDLFGDRMSDLRQHAPDYTFCGYQQFVTYIGGNLKVYRCCTTSYTQHGEIGDLEDQRFIEWFHSQKKKDMIGVFDASSCQICQFNNKNRTINYMLESNPLHVEFP